MNKKVFGFTLAELLIALSIIGIVAVLTVPSLMNNINKRVMTSQLKSIVTDIQQLATDKMVEDRTMYLEDTDFKSSSNLIRGENFEIVKTCSSCGVGGYRTIYNSNYGTPNTNAILKNGAIIGYVRESGYAPDGDNIIGRFYVDVNGVDAPNIVGRDLFSFYVSSKGKVFAMKQNQTSSDSGCKSGNPNQCLDLIMKRSWNMEY